MTGFQALASVPAMLALAGTPVSAGTGIQAGPVCLASTARPGGTYTLPPVTVQDTGSGAEAIGLQVQKQTPGRGNLPGRAVPDSWVQFTYPRKWLVLSQSSVSVSPGATAAVPAHLTIPASAKHGRYAAWIIAAPVTSTPGQLDLGASAIADLEFTVTRPGAAPRHAVCVTPGAKHASRTPPAHLTGQAATHQGRAAKHDLTPAKVRNYGEVAIVLVALGCVVAFLRRAGWL